VNETAVAFSNMPTLGLSVSALADAATLQAAIDGSDNFSLTHRRITSTMSSSDNCTFEAHEDDRRGRP
jgi:hypothetical protein